MPSTHSRFSMQFALCACILTIVSACDSSDDNKHTSLDVNNDTPSDDNNDTPSNDPPLSSGLTKEQQEQLPGDCILAFDSSGIAYCFSAPLRKFTSVNQDGTANWDYTLPGDNDTNNVEGIAVIEDNQLCIVADVTTMIGDSRHEISCFSLGGEFLNTVPTLELLPRLGDPVKPRDPLAINLDNEALLSSSDGTSFYLAGSQYMMTIDADSTIRDSWSRSSGFVARIDTVNGAALAWHSFPSAMVTDMEIAEDERIDVSIEDVNSSEIRSVLLDNKTLAAQTSTSAKNTLNTFDLPQLMPGVYSTLTGEPLQYLESHLTRMKDTLAVKLDFGEDNFCTSFNEGRGCEYSSDPILTMVDCPVSGTALITAMGKSSWNSPSKLDEKTADWVFDNCTFEQPHTDTESTEILAINGRWNLVQYTSSDTSIESESSTSTFDQLSATFGDSSNSTATGELRTRTGRVLRSSSSFDYRYGAIDKLTNARLEISDARFGYLIDKTVSGFEVDQVSIQYYGPEMISATMSSEATAGKPIQINLLE